MEGAATNRMLPQVNMGCRHMWDWACMCGSESQGVKPLLALCTWKKKQAFHVQVYELMASKEEDLISYKRHSDARLESSSSSSDGRCWFAAISGVFVLSYISVCFVLVVRQGIPMQVPWLKIPFPGIPSSTKAKIDQSGLVCLPAEPPSPSHLRPTTESSHATTSE